MKTTRKYDVLLELIKQECELLEKMRLIERFQDKTSTPSPDTED